MANSIPVSEQYGGEAMQTLKNKIDRASMQEIASQAGVAAIVVLAVVAAGLGLASFNPPPRPLPLKGHQDPAPRTDGAAAPFKGDPQRPAEARCRQNA